MMPVNDPIVPPAPPASSPPAPGALDPDWPTFAEQLEPELREQHRELLKQYKGKKLTDFTRDLVAKAQKADDPNTVRIPNTDPAKGPVSSPEEMKAFREKFGLPMAAAEYGLQPDEKVGADQAWVDAKSKYYFEHGFTKKQAQDDFKTILDNARGAQAKQAGLHDDLEKNYMVNLVKAEGGDEGKAKQTLNLAMKYIQGFSESVREKLIKDGTVYDPIMLQEYARRQREMEPRKPLFSERVMGSPEATPSRSKFGTSKAFDEEYENQGSAGRRAHQQ